MTLIEAAGWTFAVHIAGSGRPVVLLHGLLTDSRVWQPLVAALGDRYLTVAVDAPGHGATPPRRGPFTLEEEADSLVALLDAAGITGPAAWVGHSMGGMKAMRVALAHPERVAALVLISTQPYEEPQRTARPYEAMIETAKEWGISYDLARMIGQLNFSREYLDTPAGKAWIDHFQALDGNAIEGACHAVFRRGDISDRLAALRVPTLVLHGRQDVPIRIATARRYVAELPHAEFIELDGCCHTPPCERPAETAGYVAAFLDRTYAPHESLMGGVT